MAIACLTLVGLAGGAVAQSVSQSDSVVRHRVEVIDGNAAPSNTLGQRSDSDIWRQIRRGVQGQVSLPDARAGIMIQSEGEEWRARRNGPVTTYGGWLLVAVALAIVLYFAVRGRIRVEDGQSGVRVLRFSQTQRIIHWANAALFLVLGVTGLVLLFGRTLLIPLIGKSAFAAVASASMQAHNLFGPMFVLALILLAVTFLRGNFLHWRDLRWMLKGGGFFGGHASSGRYNFGEKTWYWWTIGFGGVVCVSGLVMDFPWLVPGRAALQLADLLHAIAAILFIAFGLGHIYLGSIGSEGSLDSMLTGSVDVNWARHHHDAWLADIPEAERFPEGTAPTPSIARAAARRAASEEAAP